MTSERRDLETSDDVTLEGSKGTAQIQKGVGATTKHKCQQLQQRRAEWKAQKS